MSKDLYVFNVIFKESYLEGSIVAASIEDAYDLVEKIPFDITIEKTDYEDSSFLNRRVKRNELIMKKEINLFNEFGALTINLVYEQKNFPLILEIYKEYLIDNPGQERECPINYLFEHLAFLTNDSNKEVVMQELKNLFDFENLSALLLKVFYI